MIKLELPNKGSWAENVELQIRLIVDINDDIKAQLRSVSDKNWHGSPVSSQEIVVKKSEIVDFLNAHEGMCNIVGYRYFSGEKSKLKGVSLPEIIVKQ